TGATAAVPLRILHLLADFRLGLAFPQHGERREAPVGHARHESVRRVRRLVARLTGLRRRAVAILSADDEGPMDDLLVRLPGRLDLMAVDASRVHDDAGDGLE